MQRNIFIFSLSRLLYKKIASNTIFQLLTKAITAGISIVLLSILTKNLPIEHFGMYNKIFQYLGIFAFLADLGLYTIAIREISRSNEKKETIIGNILTLRVLLGCVICVVSLSIASILPGFSSSLALISIAVVGVFTIVSLINSSLLALMQSQMQMEFSLISIISGKILNVLGVAIICLFVVGIGADMTLLGIFIIATLGITLTTYLNYIYAQNICRIRFLFDTEYMLNIFRISLPYGLALFLSVVYFKIDIIMLSLFEGEGADTSIALYSLPMKIVEVLMVVGGFYLNSLLPSLSQKIKSHTQEIRYLVYISVKVLGSFGVCIFFLTLLFGKDMMLVLATKDYIEALPYNSVDVVSIVSAVLFFHFLALISIYLLIAEEKQSLLLKVNAFIAGVNIIGNSIMIPLYSFYGAAITTLVSQIILCITVYVLVGRKYISPKKVFQCLIPSMLIGGSIYYFGVYILSVTSFGIYINIFIIGGVLFFLYSISEYILFTRSLTGEDHKK